MSDLVKLTLADPRDLADALSCALRIQGRKRVHNADEIMSEIVAKRLVEDVIVPKPSHKLNASKAAAVKSVTTKSGSLKIELHDKLAALEKLGRMVGLFQEAAPAANVTVNQLNVRNDPEPALEAARRLAFALAAAQKPPLRQSRSR